MPFCLSACKLSETSSNFLTLHCIDYIHFLLIVCKLLTVELQDALEKTGRSKEVLEIGEVLDSGKRRRKIKYNTSYVMITRKF